MTEAGDQAGGTTPATWDCEAYGPEGTRIGALCFLAGELGERVCRSPGECAEQAGSERRRVFRRINELAAAGRADFVYLVEEFARPDQLLGGPGDGEQRPPKVPPYYHNPSEEEREAERGRPIPPRLPSPPSRVGYRVFGDDGRHPAEAEGWTPPAPSLVEAVKMASTRPRSGVARLECPPDVVAYLHQVAAEEDPPVPWRPQPIVPLGSVSVVVDADMPAGSWRMVDAAGGVVWEGTVEP
ncbi:hypothetical protein [Micromonospora sp. RP3T]|uniref:hypothetical protein n=1 Tax=Micromonospora sp. RP3T TaxID=2135446 RepID=UPI003D72953E